MPEINNLYSAWISSSSINEKEKQALQQLSFWEIQKRFAHPLHFNKAGFRNHIGIGATLFNRHTTKQIICSLISLLKQNWNNLENKKALIFYDSRHFSYETCRQVAAIFSHFGMIATVPPKNVFNPSPFLNYLLNQQIADVGIMITSSHQKPDTNGLKIFFPKQGMATNKFVGSLNQDIQKNHLKFLNLTIEAQKNLLHVHSFISEKKQYFSEITKKFSTIVENKKSLKIVYSSLHGTGLGWADEIIRQQNHQVILVSEQCQFDSNFSHAPDPNPENPETFKLAQSLATKNDADLIIINDPDCDRMRVAVRDFQGYRLLKGNEIGTIFLYFLLNELKKKGTIYTTIVSTSLIKIMAKDYGCEVVETITGFANLSEAFYAVSNRPFLLAFEESLGFLIDHKINSDKDGVLAAFFFVQIANWLKNKDRTLIDFLDDVSKKYGYFSYTTKKLHLLSDDQIVDLNQKVKLLKYFGNFKVKKIVNFSKLGDPNLFKIYFSENFWIACRPSVTEPIYKFYFVCWEKTASESQKLMNELEKAWSQEFANFFPPK